MRERYVEQLAALRQALEEPFLRPGLAFVQPGKDASMSLYPLGSMPLDELGAAAWKVVEELGPPFNVAMSVHGVELVRRASTKVLAHGDSPIACSYR